MKKLLVVCGPTATGKTSLGIRLAKEFKGEIISADSRQVYKGMDVITGKESGKEVKTWLLDVVEPNEDFSVAHYVKLARQAIEDVWQRRKLPILVGGTGLYIKALIEGMATLNVPPVWPLRKKLAGWPVAKLAGKLKKLDLQKWQRMNESDRQNPRRLIRAIEIGWQGSQSQPKKPISQDCLLIGLKAPFKFLYRRIDKRVAERVKAGAEAEVRRLLKKYSFTNSVLGATIGYRQWRAFFEGKANREEVIQSWQFAEHGYARRQITWFKKALRQTQGKTCWFDISQPQWQDKVVKLVKSWYDQDNAPKS